MFVKAKDDYSFELNVGSAAAATKGDRRPNMEDAHAVYRKVKGFETLSLVLDGHGDATGEDCEGYMVMAPEVFLQVHSALSSYYGERYDHKIHLRKETLLTDKILRKLKKKLEEDFEKTNKIAKAKDTSLSPEDKAFEVALVKRIFSNYLPEGLLIGGTTITGVVINADPQKKPTIYAFNAGDSRSVACYKDEIRVITRDHKPYHKDEAERINNAGGDVIGDRIDRKLNVSRGLGDPDSKAEPRLNARKQKVIADPDVFEVPTEDLLFILSYTDGVGHSNNDAQIVLQVLEEGSLGYDINAVSPFLFMQPFHFACQTLQNMVNWHAIQSKDNATIVYTSLRSKSDEFTQDLKDAYANKATMRLVTHVVHEGALIMESQGLVIPEVQSRTGASDSSASESQSRGAQIDRSRSGRYTC